MRKELLRNITKPMVPLSASIGYTGAAAVSPMEDIAHNF